MAAREMGAVSLADALALALLIAEFDADRWPRAARPLACPFRAGGDRHRC